MNSILTNGSQQRVTTIIAPVGYGKTSLLCDWLQRENLSAKTAWITLDRLDNSIQQFWQYLVFGLKKVLPELAMDPEYIRQNLTDPLQLTALNPLFNEVIATRRDVFLVLDNFHVISAPAVLDSLSYLIEHQPRNLHLFLAGRCEPALALSRLRIQKELVEITSRDLAFSFPEVKTYFSSLLKLHPEPDLLAEVYRSSEGWITGIQMAAQSIKENWTQKTYPFEKLYDSRLLSDYISEEVLNQQPPDVQEFLLQTALLGEFTLELCDSVLGQTNSKALLDKLRCQSLSIIPVDSKGEWLRYHRLVSIALSNLQKQQHPEWNHDLNAAAANWAYQHGYPGRAINYSIAAGNLERAIDILDESAMKAIINFDYTGLVDWTSRFPDSLLRQRPSFGIYYALANLMAGRVDLVEPVLQIVEGVLNEEGQQFTEERRELARWMITVIRLDRELMYEDTCNQPLINEVTRYIPKEDSYLYGYLNHNVASHYLRNLQFEDAVREFQLGIKYAQEHQIKFGHAFSICGVAKVRKHQGRLTDADWEYKKALNLIQPISDQFPMAEAMIKTGLGELALLRNDLDSARKLFEEIISKVNFDKADFLWYEDATILSRIANYYLAVDDLDSARKYYILARKFWLANSRSQYIMLPELMAVQTQIWVRTNELELNATGLTSRIEYLESVHKPILAEQVSIAHILLSQSNPAGALEVLNNTLPTAEKMEYRELAYEIMKLTARAYELSGQHEQALSVIMDLIKTCAPEGNCQMILDRDNLIHNLIAENKRRFFESGADIIQVEIANFFERLLPSPVSNLNETNQGSSKPSLPGGKDTKNLSSREIEILELLAEGKSIKEISAVLMISVNTTKTHVKSIYRKFDEHNGKAVILRAYELGILNSPGRR